MTKTKVKMSEADAKEARKRLSYVSQRIGEVAEVLRAFRDERDDLLKKINKG